MKPTEAQILTTIEKLFGKLNVRNNKQGAFSTKGLLDFTVFINGLADNVEIKIDGDSLSKTQQDFIRLGWKNSYCLHFNSKDKTFKIYYHTLCYHSVFYKEGLTIGKDFYSFDGMEDI